MSGEYHVVAHTGASPSRRWPQRFCLAQPASAQPLAMNDPGFFPFPGSIFQQVVREPAPQAMPRRTQRDRAAGRRRATERFRRQVVAYNTSEAPGTIIIDTPNTYLYYVLGGGRAIRYGIGVGRDGFTWSGAQTITASRNGRTGIRRRK